MTPDEVNTNQETVCLIPTEEFGMRKICARWCTRNLKERLYARLSTVFDIQMRYSEDTATLFT
jgi:hypothetical protein